MVDREKVIKAWESVLSRDPLDVPWDLIDDTLIMLKAQEAVKPTADDMESINRLPNGDMAIPIIDIEHAQTVGETTRPVFNGRYWECEQCKERYKDILVVKEYKHCPGCGRRIEWQ